LFVPLQQRIMDTRNGMGGYSTPMPANTWRTVPVAGVGTIPVSGVSAVQVTVTAVGPASQGEVFVAASSAISAPVPALIYGVPGDISASTIVAVGADGKIKASAQTTVTLLIDVQGYYTSGAGTAAGGYVPINPRRIADSRSTTTAGANGLPVNGRLAKTTPYTVQVSGAATGIPQGASAVFVSLVPISYDATSGRLTPWATGDDKPNVSLNFPGNTSTAIGAVVPLSANGSFDVAFDSASAGGPISLVVDVVGYFTASDAAAGAFTPAATRVLDTRTAPNVPVAGNATVMVPVAGINGVPAAGAGISAVAVGITEIHTGSNAGDVRMWNADRPEPVPTVVNYPAGASIRNDLVVVATSADGKVKIHNRGADPIDVVLDVFGWYSNVAAPIQNGQSTTAQRVTLQAGKSGGPWVSYQYRTGTTSAFAAVPVANVTVPGTGTHPAGWPVGKNGSGSFDPYTWDMAGTVGNTDQLVQVQACYGTTATDPSPVCSMPSNVQLGVDGFQNAYATTDLGPGTLSELTGDYRVSATDVDQGSYQGSMTVGRSLTTLAPADEQTGPAGVFGPGWTASLASSDGTGDADLSVVDHSADGYLIFNAADGSASAYQASTTVGTYPMSFVGVDDAAASGAKVVMVSASKITMADLDGTVTTWVKTGALWAVSSVAQTGSASTTSYTYNAAGLPTRLLGAVPAGVSCASPDATRGCRSLTFGYTTVTVGGVARTRLTSVSLVAYNPAAAAMASTPVQSYTYDTTGRLAATWDPRIAPNLKTSYTYNTAGRLATMTPPGLAAWTLGYDSTGRVSTVSRPDPSGPTAVSTVVYGAPFTGTGAPFDVGAAAAASWGQTADLAATGTAVFTPSRVPAGITPATVTGADWPWASIDYLDVNGRTVNAAGYGAAAWQSDATQYDSNGNAVWSLTAGNRAQALSPTTDTDPAVAATTATADRANLLATTTIYDPLNPSNVTDTFGPTHPVDGTGSAVVDARSHTNTAYDQGAPADGTTYNLPTTTSQSAQTLDGVDHNTVTTMLGYGAVNAGDPTGWSLRLATTSTVQMGPSPGAADLTTTTRYNTAGQTITQSLPGSSGTDARTRTTSYYTATGTGVCVNPAFAGLVCQVGPAAQPPSGNPLPVNTTSYNTYNQATTTTEVAGTTTRSSTTSYDTAERMTGSSIVVTPTAAGGTPVPATTTTYSPMTGLRTTSAAAGQTLTTGYDTLGRVSSYTDGTGNTATSSYDLAGRVASVNDGKGTTSYTYDTPSEHRSLVTSQDLGTGSPAGSTLTALWDAGGNLVSQTYPNGIAAVTDYNTPTPPPGSPTPPAATPCCPTPGPSTRKDAPQQRPATAPPSTTATTRTDD